MMLIGILIGKRTNKLKRAKLIPLTYASTRNILLSGLIIRSGDANKRMGFGLSNTA